MDTTCSKDHQLVETIARDIPVPHPVYAVGEPPRPQHLTVIAPAYGWRERTLIAMATEPNLSLTAGTAAVSGKEGNQAL